MIFMAAFTLIVIAHTIADFFLQTDDQAKGKSSSFRALGSHIIAYTTFLIITVYPVAFVAAFATWSSTGRIDSIIKIIGLPVLWCIINGCLHFLTDYITSRASSYAWSNENRHDFFCIIGVDQAIHILTLCWTAYAMYAVFF